MYTGTDVGLGHRSMDSGWILFGMIDFRISISIMRWEKGYKVGFLCVLVPETMCFG